jgi:hypothetical protein
MLRRFRLPVVLDMRADRDVLVEPLLDLVELLVDGLASSGTPLVGLPVSGWMKTTRTKGAPAVDS